MYFRTGIVMLAVMLGVMSSAHAEKPAPPALEQAIKQAAAAHKPLIVELGAEWCEPCLDFEQLILPIPRVQAALKNVVFVRYDTEKGVGELANSRLRAHSLPTFVALDGDGIELFRMTGALNATKFIAAIDRARNETVNEAQVKAWVSAKPGYVGNLFVAAKWLSARGRSQEAIAVYERLTIHKAATESQRTDAKNAMIRLRRATRDAKPR